MAAKKNDIALLDKGKIEVKCVVTQKEDYILRIPKVGFYASSRTNTLEVTKSGLIANATGDELDMDFQVIRLKDKKVIASGFVKSTTPDKKEDNASATDDASILRQAQHNASSATEKKGAGKK